MNINGKETRLKSLINFRDIGEGIDGNGTPVRKGLIYRSANPDRISKKDEATLRKIGIKTIIDLRGPSEVKNNRKKLDGVNVVSLPLDFDTRTKEILYPLFYIKNSEEKILEVSNSLYLEIADAAAPVLAEIIDIMLSPDPGAILIHCQAGKDRTGIIVALLHLLAGTDKQVIVNDFMRSNDELIPYFRKVMMVRKIISFGLFPYSKVIFAIRVKQNNIESVIKRISDHSGGVEGYLASAGFDTSKLTLFRKKILLNGKE